MRWTRRLLARGPAEADVESHRRPMGIDSLASGGSLLTAGLSGLAGGLLTPDSDAQFNQAIALVDITNLPKSADVDAYARKEFLNKLGVFLTATIGTEKTDFKINTWANRKDDHWSVTDPNGKYGKVYTSPSTHDICNTMLNDKLEEASSYNEDFDIAANLEWQKERFGEACGIRTSPILVGDIVDSNKLPWLEEGRKYIVVTSKFGTSISQNVLADAVIPVDGLYMYYTTNGANVGKLKDTEHPRIFISKYSFMKILGGNGIIINSYSKPISSNSQRTFCTFPDVALPNSLNIRPALYIMFVEIISTPFCRSTR